LPEDEQTSKHGGGGRYNAVLEFKGRNKKRKKERKNEEEEEEKSEYKEKNEKRKNMSMYDIKIK
jgi:hypothetical protein